jgi:hypothetical protein
MEKLETKENFWWLEDVCGEICLVCESKKTKKQRYVCATKDSGNVFIYPIPENK